MKNSHPRKTLKIVTFDSFSRLFDARAERLREPLFRHFFRSFLGRERIFYSCRRPATSQSLPQLLFLIIRALVFAIARSAYRAPEPRNPKSAFLQSEKCHFGTPPRKIAPKVNFLGILIPEKKTFLDILIDFWGHFPVGAPKWHFSDFKMQKFGVLGFRGSVGGPGDCKTRLPDSPVVLSGALNRLNAILRAHA